MKHIFTLLLVLSSSLIYSQNSYTIKGVIRDTTNNETLIGANAYLKETYKGSSTDLNGNYSITEKAGKYTLVVSYLGYETQEYPINLNKDITFNIKSKPKSILAKEVVITGVRASKNVQSTEMGKVTVTTEDAKKLPVLFGEVDIIKTLQLMPGVQSGGEGNAGLYVRGGGPDQNLMLFDDATIYNAAHLFGFFSVFNGDAVKDITLTKGGIPAEYGERLSSVVDVTGKEGRYDTLEVNGGIGLIASRLSVEGPIKKDTSSFLIAARRTYIEAFTVPFLKGKENEGSGYFFHDFNAKFTYKFSTKDKLYLSGYYGKDQFTFNNVESGSELKSPWTNIAATLRWNHLFNNRLAMNTSLIFSKYNFEFNIGQNQAGTPFNFKLFSGIQDYKAKVDFNYSLEKHKIKFGVSSIYHDFTPSNVKIKAGDVTFDTGEIEKLYGVESGAYIQDEVDLTKKLSINAGIRLSTFTHFGPFERFVKNGSQYVDSIQYGKGDAINTYYGIEPRASFRYQLDSVSSVKWSYTRNYQYIHLLALGQLSFPTDVWYPSTDLVKPQIGDQFSIGYFRNFKENTYETSFETYYKTMQNQIAYKELYSPQQEGKDNSDNALVFGTGEAYGFEFLVKKNRGKLTGWVAYTLSYTNRQFDELNNGNKFYARYDRRHDISIVTMYELSKKWNFGATFVYASGNPFTVPIGIYYQNNSAVNIYDGINNVRAKDYHRLDFSATYVRKPERTTYKSSWVFGIYNVYNRFNPYITSVESKGDPATGTVTNTATEIQIFPFIPSVTWNFKF